MLQFLEASHMEQFLHFSNGFEWEWWSNFCKNEAITIFSRLKVFTIKNRKVARRKMQRTTQLHNLSLLSVLQYFSKIMPTQQKRKIMPLSFKKFYNWELLKMQNQFVKQANFKHVFLLMTYRHKRQKGSKIMNLYQFVLFFYSPFKVYQD